MYNAFFGFRKAPFASKPDPEFFFRSNQHDAAVKGLLLSIEARMGLITLVGGKGTGKTAVLECLRDSLAPEMPCAFIRDSRISVSRFLETLTSDLNLDLRFTRKSDARIFLALTRFATQQARNGHSIVLLVDGAHDLPKDLFYEILHLASLLHGKVKTIQTVFAGRPELQPRLADLNPDRVGQRAILSRSLQPFTARETQEYIEFRLACAGMPKQTVFAQKVLEDIYERSHGFAPAIHALCDELLLTAFSSTSKVCTREICDQVFKRPPTPLTQNLGDAQTIAADTIDRLRHASLRAPEPPPMQTVLLRVAVDARPGSLRPRTLGTDVWAVQREAVTSKVIFPLRTLTLAGAELPKGSKWPVHIGDCAQAAAFLPSWDRGPEITSIPVPWRSPRLPKAAAETRALSSLQPSASALVPLRNLGSGPSPTPVHRGSFPELCSPPQKPAFPQGSFRPASVIPWLHIALAPTEATEHAVPPPSAKWSLEMEPAHLISVGRPAALNLSASLHPSVQRSNVLLPLALSTRPVPPPVEQPIGHSLSFEPTLYAYPPDSHLEPADPSSRPIATSRTTGSSLADSFTVRTQRVPRKSLLAFVILMLAALALYNAPPTMHAAVEASRRGWQQAQQALLNRAAVALDEDFRAGLSDWTNRGGAAPLWTSDSSGFVRPGAIALYRPSRAMANYRIQFLGTIDKKAMSWAVRAADFNNYYAVRLTVLKPGPLPLIGVTRYAVIHGIPQQSVTTPLLMRAQADTVYRVSMDIQGDRFVLSVQDQDVDSWSEPRLRHGGIGFFSESDAGSRIAGLHVRGQDDMLGRLCAFLLPSSISSSR